VFSLNSPCWAQTTASPTEILLISLTPLLQCPVKGEIPLRLQGLVENRIQYAVSSNARRKIIPKSVIPGLTRNPGLTFVILASHPPTGGDASRIASISNTLLTEWIKKNGGRF